jgi:hypothetical protein
VNSMGVDVSSSLVYAVKETRNGRCVNTEQLGLIGINAYALELRNNEGIDFVYGCDVGVDCLRSGASFKGKDAVDKFAEKFGFGKPDLRISTTVLTRKSLRRSSASSILKKTKKNKVNREKRRTLN